MFTVETKMKKCSKEIIICLNPNVGKYAPMRLTWCISLNMHETFVPNMPIVIRNGMIFVT